jgi:hypothetical protein
MVSKNEKIKGISGRALSPGLPDPVIRHCIVYVGGREYPDFNGLREIAVTEPKVHFFLKPGIHKKRPGNNK